MKIIIGLFFFYSLKLLSADYIFDSRGSSEQKTLKFKDNSKYIQIETNGWWTDSDGNYGTERCIGKTESSDKDIQLDIYCEIIDQNRNIIRVSRKRNSSIGAGVGINTYLEVPEKYVSLLGKACTYAVLFLNKDFFYKQKCN